MLGSDVDCAVGVDGDVHGLADRGRRACAQFTVAHAIGKENGYGAATAVRYIDCGAGVNGEIHWMHVGAIVLKREARLAAGGKFVDEAGGGVGDIDDRFTVASHGDGLSELAWTLAVGAPGVDVLEGRRRRLLSGGGLRGARAASN